MTRAATTVLGKRKSRSGTNPAAVTESPKIAEEDAQAIFRRHFEAQFAPLAGTKSRPKTSRRAESEDEDEDEDDSMTGGSEERDLDEDGDQNEWAGLSGSEEDDDDDDDDSPESAGAAVEVVDYSKPTSGGTSSTVKAALSKREAKAYLSSKVPASIPSSSSQKPAKKSKPTPTDEDSADLLRNDLALQRLLSEAHLLNPTKASHSLLGSAGDPADDRTTHTGRNRLLATDLRLAALGSRASIYKQQRMPMAHRKGIEGARASREAKRRREAKENGIILERPAAPKGGAGGGTSRRARAVAVDAPAVGRMRDGMLRLSKRDVAEIQGGGGGGRRERGAKMRKRRR